ncbi:hypothetical protein B0H15DRAFT_1027211 [Mycena belliarum]|uniref:NmrA-like domain-containing protein n=1 Tax=Mycena belliarum TaxID=1033014 RepID=A0AAD6XEY8_9AGAR|nr:hypothetical protein B0H15DRAFT_1027211 [Mycena belliae]
MSSYYKSFAVVGGGTLGLPIVNALAATGASVVLLSRPGSAAKPVPPGVQTATVDTRDAAAVAAVLTQHSVDVVLSTVTTLAAGDQAPLIEAARRAGVKLFAPSEYGMPTDGQTEGILGAKNQAAAALKAAGIPSVRFFVGMFTEFAPWLVGYAEHKKVQIIGKGDVPVSWTSIGDIAGFVAHVLTTSPPSELENQIIRLEGDRRTFLELGALFKAEVEHVPDAGGITGEQAQIKGMLLGIVATGAGSSGWDAHAKVEGTGSRGAGSGNTLWPGHQWKTFKDIHNL